MAKIASLRRTGSRRIKGAHSAPKSTVSISRNASGYQKRLERKNKRPPTNDPDVYEYSATRDRRANITLDIDKDELRGLGQDTLDSDAANKAMEMLRKRLLLIWAKTWALSIVKTTKISIPMQPSKGKAMRSVSVLSNSRKSPAQENGPSLQKSPQGCHCPRYWMVTVEKVPITTTGPATLTPDPTKGRATRRKMKKTFLPPLMTRISNSRVMH
ncbi:hypothetical protein BS47DRAFT_1356104 [Hydnum rufescens UP504]|uniref:Uncharacterized protein n=1 Tax=Hydnum rufescens UP504 TaxID=1448309 RepID=A0A9P6DLU9_9AGAM|nr:hypothetical protein BS47DRAFT_1356104 [Hydnum rufescens UP504]